MRVALVTDAFPPLRSSGAVQLRDLSREFVRQGHELSVLVASPELDTPWQMNDYHGVRIIRLKAPKTKDTGYLRRTVGEFLMPFHMLRNFRKSPAASTRFDGVVWYSPTIFLGPLVKALKRESDCSAYLILRDIFPEWAADMKLMGRGLPYRFFKAVANFQYSVADTIGVQTPGNISFLRNARYPSPARVEVLHNWLAQASDAECSIQITQTSLAGRKIFVYAGNMGIAQGMGILLDLMTELRTRTDIGFVFVGRGSEVANLRVSAKHRDLNNVLFFDEIDPDEIAGLYAQCRIGLIALDPRHRTHNIPGKFLSYMQSGLPVLATVNAGNDLIKMVEDNDVGFVSTDNSVLGLAALAKELVEKAVGDPGMVQRAKLLATGMFSPQVTVKQIVAALLIP